jgi:hypothetical protein
MTGTYLTEDVAKEELKQDVSLNNEVFTEWFENKVGQSNRQVENDLSEDYAGNFPTDTNSATYKSFADAALAWIVYQWKLKQGVDNIADFKKAYDSIIDGLITNAKSKPTDNMRSKQASYSTSYSSSLLKNIPGMTDTNGNLI